MAGPTTPDVSQWLTPALAQNPGLASDVANTSANKTDAATVLSHANNVVTTTNAIQNHITSQGTQGFWSRLGGNTWSTLSFLNKPLQEVQKDYKFIHSVYTDHGVLPGLLATLGVAGSTVAGTLLAGPGGGMAAADISAAGIRAILGQKYTDSLAKSNDPNYKVSFGRDFSNGLGQLLDHGGGALLSGLVGEKVTGTTLKNTNVGFGSTVSGMADAAFDFKADPLMIAGKANAAMKAGRFLKPTVIDNAFVLQARYPLGRVIPGVQDFLASHSMRAFSPEQVNAVRNGGIFNVQSNQYNRALGAMADYGKDALNTTFKAKGTTAADLAAGTIAFNYPSMGVDTAGRLGAIVTEDLPKSKIEDNIHDFITTQVYLNELQGNLAGAALLPSRTLLHPLISVADYLRNKPGMVGSTYQTFSSYMPYSIDPVLNELSTKEFRYNAPDATRVIYGTNRFSQGHQYALEMAGQYATAIAKGGSEGLRDAHIINAQSTFDTLKALGLPDKNEVVKNVKNTLDQLNGDKEMGAGIYGVAPSERGANISDYVTLDGKHANAAIDEWQASDMLPIPDYLKAKRALRDLGIISSKLGAVDDFVADQYTNKFFKPLALATAGFGIRVAASELLLAASRYGPGSVLKAKIASSAAKANYKLYAGQEHNFVSAVLTGLGVGKGVPTDLAQGIYPAFQSAKAKGLNFAAKLTANEQLDVASRLVADLEGDVVVPAVSSGGHGEGLTSSYESGQQIHSIFQKQKSALQYRDLPKFTTFTPDSPDYLGRYATQLMHYKTSAMGKNIATDIGDVFGKVKSIYPSQDNPRYMALRNTLIDREEQRIMDTKAGNYLPYQRAKGIVDRWADQDPREFAADRVDTILGLGIGADGTIQHGILDGIANGKSPTINELSQLPNKSLPAEVAGQQIAPYGDTNNMLSNVISLGFKKAFNPIINTLAREPLYVLHVGEEYGSMKYAVSQGALTDQQAFNIAKTRAAYAMIPQIHNTALKTQFSVFVRNFLPFYFAQEQAWKRSINAMKDTSVVSPIFSSTVRQYQMVEQLMTNPTFVTQDSNGNSYANFPLVGEFMQNLQKALAHYGVPMVSGLPISVSGSISSLKSVIPDMNKLPGVSPFVAVSGNIVGDWFPGLQPAINKVLGQSAQRGFWDTVDPNAMSKNIWNAISPNEQNAAMQNALFGAMSSAYYHQDPGFSPQANLEQRRALIDRIQNNARSILIMKAALNLLSPLAPKVEQVDMGMREEFVKLMKQKGNFPAAMLAFTGEHGNSAVSYTISKSTASVPGATFPYVTAAIKWIDDNQNLINGKDTGTGAMYLVPQDPGKTGQETAIYQDLLRQHLRSIKTPQEFLSQLYISAGSQEIAPTMKIHKQRVAELTANQDTYGLSQEQTAWSGAMKKMENLYPEWYTQYTSKAPQANASIALGQFRTIFASPSAPTNEQAQQVKLLVKDYDAHNANMVNAKQSGDVTLAKIEKDGWKNYLDNLEKQDPRLGAVINSVFLRLD